MRRDTGDTRRGADIHAVQHSSDSLDGRVEINGRVIPVTGAELNYEADTPVWKGGVADGVLVMKDGTKYDIKYSMDYDVFTIKDKFGMYVSRA